MRDAGEPGTRMPSGSRDRRTPSGSRDTVREPGREDAARAGKMLLEQVIAAELLSQPARLCQGGRTGASPALNAGWVLRECRGVKSEAYFTAVWICPCLSRLGSVCLSYC